MVDDGPSLVVSYSGNSGVAEIVRRLDNRLHLHKGGTATLSESSGDGGNATPPHDRQHRKNREEQLHSSARSRIACSVLAPCASGGGASPVSVIRWRWASSQWRPSKNRRGCRLVPSMSSRQRALTLMRCGWARGM